MKKLISVTWSDNDVFDYKSSMLYTSFIKYNNENDFHSIHFNRNNYKDLENEFNSRFGNQYEFLLYRIFLLKQELEKLDFEYVIFSDTNDVVCLGDIHSIIENPSSIMFSSESHRYPNEENVTNWSPIFKYPDINNHNLNYLNGGLSFGKKENFIKLFDICIREIFPKEYKNFGGDQGVFTYLYLNLNQENLIILDENYEIFLSTYLKSYDGFGVDGDKFVSYNKKTTPLFVHDNGWNYGSPKFIIHFNLSNL
jgi:hypothetical protein